MVIDYYTVAKNRILIETLFKTFAKSYLENNLLKVRHGKVRCRYLLRKNDDGVKLEKLDKRRKFYVSQFLKFIDGAIDQ